MPRSRRRWSEPLPTIGDPGPAGEVAAVPPDACLRWAERVVGDGARVVGVRVLHGWAAAVHGLELRTATGMRPAVLKRFVRAWVADEPHVPGNEAAALRLLVRSTIPVPRLLGADLGAAACDAPALLLSLAPGRPRTSRSALAASLAPLAATLVQIHAVPIAEGELPTYEPWYLDGPDRPPAWATDDGAWLAAFAIARGPRPTTPDRLVHRDYNPWNVLWRRGQVSAVVDWGNACIGPAEVDVAHLRHNLWAIGGRALADGFLVAWQQASGVAEYDPFWDIQSAVEWLPDTSPGAAAVVTHRHEAFLVAALRRHGPRRDARL